MGLFSKKKIEENEETRQLNQLLNIALEMNQETGTWHELPTDVPIDVQTLVINARKMIFEYIRQLKEAKFYSNNAVHKFAKEEYPWVSKDNVLKCISLGQYL